MSCPITGAAAAAPSSDTKASGCPFARLWQQQKPEEREPAPAPPANSADEPQAAPHAAEPPAPATCPYGFGSRAGAKGARHLGELHCVLCSSLLHEAARAEPCAHVFCAACVSRARDCPVCGRDIESVSPAHDAQALVDTYLESHGRDASGVAAQQHALEEDAAGDGGGGFGRSSGGGGGGGALAVGDGTPASFFLYHGLRSLLGGNTDAALSRLGRSRELLLAESADPDDPSAAASLACRLGAACGSLGDAWRRRGDMAAAEASLRESAGALRPHTGGDAEAAHALSVTLNKLGDLEYYKQQQPQQPQHAGADAAGAGRHSDPGVAAAAAALPLYEEALGLRRALCGPLSGGRAGPGATLDLVAALAKVADAHESLGDGGAARHAWHQAAGELHELKLAAGGSLEGALASKMRTLEELLALRGHVPEGQE